MQTHRITVPTPLGPLSIEGTSKAITRVSFRANGPKTSHPLPLLQACKEQLQGYFAGTRKEFTLPIKPSGTRFEERIWKALQQIPFGETRSYADIARAIGHPAAARAVGQACAKNPLVLLIPCHRVIASGRGLGGFSAGLKRKRWLVTHEHTHEVHSRARIMGIGQPRELHGRGGDGGQP